jgi:hypothetical protein
MDVSPATQLQWDRIRDAQYALSWPRVMLLSYIAAVAGRHPELLTAEAAGRVLAALADLRRWL